MFGRSIEIKLKKWKSSDIRKPLIIRGARQVGKTSIIRKFASENFNSLLEINLEKPDQKEFFKNVESVEDFIRKAEYYTKVTVSEGKTLVFIDEIQESPEILKLLRFFAEEKPNLHLIVAGSLLEVKMSGEWNVPVGRVEYMFLYPMTFFEYLGVIGQGKLKDDPATTKLLLEKHFKDYLIIGGMPEVISSFARDGSFKKTEEILNRLSLSYEDDIDKYAKASERKYLQLVMKVGPRSSGGIYKYENFGDSGFRGREVRNAMSLLEKTMLLKEVPSINSINLPFVYKTKRAKKLIWLDVGIVNFVNSATDKLLRGVYGGKVMEQFVGQTLLARGLKRGVDLTFWARNKDEGSAEVDFCFQYKNKIVGLEVKSGKSNSLKSLFSMKDIGGEDVILVRVSWDPLKIEEYKHSGETYKVLSVPFYLLEDIETFLKNLKTATA